MYSFNLKERIFRISTEDEFDQLSLEVYNYQKDHCPVYGSFVEMLKRKKPLNYREIPCLPISLFKEKEIISTGSTVEMTFLSSGTGGMERSRHLVADTEIYKTSFELAYRKFIGNPEKQVILALLPNYLEQGNSSLVYMVKALIKMTDSSLSGFVLNDFQQLTERYQQALEQERSVVIFGVSYALLDLAAQKPDLSMAKIIETGGMKGKRKELPKEELHRLIRDGLGVANVLSEYGMTELLSQAYSNEAGIFHTPEWMKVLVRDVNDPFSYVVDGKTGGVNVIDLANLNSCAFIATQDLGKREGSSFRILGRFDQSDIRGCNLMVE